MKGKKIQINKLNDGERGYIIGLFIGDGYQYYDRWRHYKVEFYLNPKKDLDIAKYLICLLQKLGVNPYIMHKKGCLIIRMNSKLLFLFLQKQTLKIKVFENIKFTLGLISGLIDSDGYVPKGEIIITNKNWKLLKDISCFCQKSGIYTKIWKQQVICRNKSFIISRLRISTKFKYEKHYSQKINRIYCGALPIIASKHPKDIAYTGRVARRSRRAHNP